MKGETSMIEKNSLFIVIIRFAKCELYPIVQVNSPEIHNFTREFDIMTMYLMRLKKDEKDAQWSLKI